MFYGVTTHDFTKAHVDLTPEKDKPLATEAEPKRYQSQGLLEKYPGRNYKKVYTTECKHAFISLLETYILDALYHQTIILANRFILQIWYKTHPWSDQNTKVWHTAIMWNLSKIPTIKLIVDVTFADRLIECWTANGCSGDCRRN